MPFKSVKDDATWLQNMSRAQNVPVPLNFSSKLVAKEKIAVERSTSDSNWSLFFFVLFIEQFFQNSILKIHWTLNIDHFVKRYETLNSNHNLLFLWHLSRSTYNSSVWVLSVEKLFSMPLLKGEPVGGELFFPLACLLCELCVLWPLLGTWIELILSNLEYL